MSTTTKAPVVDANIDVDQLITQSFRKCPPHQSDQRFAYIVLCSDEWTHLEATGHIQLSNIDLLMQQRSPDLYQHIHLHQQATDAINFKITSSLLLAANCKISDNLKETVLQQQLYLLCILAKTDEVGPPRMGGFTVPASEALSDDSLQKP